MILQESQTVELKTSFSDEVIISLVAFANANANGGSVYVGVKDNGEIQGVELGKETNSFQKHLKKLDLSSDLVQVFIAFNRFAKTME